MVEEEEEEEEMAKSGTGCTCAPWSRGVDLI
jgi:hypothetical protein